MLDAAEYYEQESLGAKAGFLNSLQQCKRRISDFPQIGAIVQDKVRRYHLKTYPYTLLYYIQPNGDIRIIAVMHQKRRPLYWLGRE